MILFKKVFTFKAKNEDEYSDKHNSYYENNEFTNISMYGLIETCNFS